MPEPTRPAPGLSDLFWGFLSIGIIGFGGVLPWARRMVVDQRRWLTQAEFTDLLGLCQFLPGPNIVNFSVALGSRFHGVAGAAAAVVGLISLPMVAVVALGSVYAAHSGHPVVARAADGLAAAASGLVVATALRIASPLHGRRLGIAVALVVVAAIAWLRLPLIPTMLVMAPASVLLHAWARPRRQRQPHEGQPDEGQRHEGQRHE